MARKHGLLLLGCMNNVEGYDVSISKLAKVIFSAAANRVDVFRIPEVND